MENTIGLFNELTESLNSLDDKQKRELIRIIRNSMNNDRNYVDITKKCFYMVDQRENNIVHYDTVYESIFKENIVYDMESFLEHVETYGYCFRIYKQYKNKNKREKLCDNCKINYKKYSYK